MLNSTNVQNNNLSNDDNAVWVVGQSFIDPEDFANYLDGWEFQGVFSSEEKALAAVNGYSSDHIFLAKVFKDEVFPEEKCGWSLCWYPKLEDKPVRFLRGGEGPELVGDFNKS